MSIDIMAAVWQSGPTNSSDRFILLALADRANHSGYCWPSYSDIAKRCAVSRPTVVKAISRLEAGGWVELEVRFKPDGSRNSNGIQIVMSRLGLADGGGKESLPQVVKPVNQGSKAALPGVVKNLYQGGKDSLPKSSLNHHIEPSEDEEVARPELSPLIVLQEHFVKRTGFQPNAFTPTYERDWQQPLERLLELAHGDPAAGCDLIDRALAVARGENERRKVYTVSCPRSIAGMATNAAATRQTEVATADVDSLWQRAITAVTKKEFSDERLRAAIRAIGGTDRITRAKGSDAENLKRSLANAYRTATPA